MPAGGSTMVDLDCLHCGCGWSSRAKNGGDTRCPTCGARRRVPSAAVRYHPGEGDQQTAPSAAPPAVGRDNPSAPAPAPRSHAAPAPAAGGRLGELVAALAPSASHRAPARRAARPPRPRQHVERVHGWAVTRTALPGRCTFARWAGDDRWHWCQLTADGMPVAGWPACLGHAEAVERNRGLYAGAARPPAGTPVEPAPAG